MRICVLSILVLAAFFSCSIAGEDNNGVDVEVNGNNGDRTVSVAGNDSGKEQASVRKARGLKKGKGRRRRRKCKKGRKCRKFRTRRPKPTTSAPAVDTDRPKRPNVDETKEELEEKPERGMPNRELEVDVKEKNPKCQCSGEKMSFNPESWGEAFQQEVISASDLIQKKNTSIYVGLEQHVIEINMEPIASVLAEYLNTALENKTPVCRKYFQRKNVVQPVNCCPKNTIEKATNGTTACFKEPCKDGYFVEDYMCVKQGCPEPGMIDRGLICAYKDRQKIEKGITEVGKKIYNRNMYAKVARCSNEGSELHRDLCYDQCDDEEFDAFGTACWQRCPVTTPYSAGALCLPTKTTKSQRMLGRKVAEKISVRIHNGEFPVDDDFMGVGLCKNEDGNQQGDIEMSQEFWENLPKSILTADKMDKSFGEWKAEYDVSYSSVGEEEAARQRFEANRLVVRKHNEDSSDKKRYELSRNAAQ